MPSLAVKLSFVITCTLHSRAVPDSGFVNLAGTGFDYTNLAGAGFVICS